MARPPRLPDTAIHAVIADLRRTGAPVTGTRLREELRRRHGSRCGVTRIYRLLRDSAPPAPALHVPSGQVAAEADAADFATLHAQLAAALERAQLAEYREERHQVRWAAEIHELRQRVRDQAEIAHRITVLEGLLADRARELAAAYRRIADLEQPLPPP